MPTDKVIQGRIKDKVLKNTHPLEKSPENEEKVLKNTPPLEKAPKIENQSKLLLKREPVD